MTKQQAQALTCICRHHGLDSVIVPARRGDAGISDGGGPQE